MHNLEIGPLSLTFMRTVRVKEVDTSNLPPGLGMMEVFKVSDYSQTCPKHWEQDAYFVAMHDTEAMWLNFQCCTPVALLVGVGGINALSGKDFETKLIKDNYLVCPPQPWLDGWKSDDGNVYQFVSTTAGEGLSVGEQLIETKEHAMQISVFEAKDPEKLAKFLKPSQTWSNEGCIGSSIELCSLQSCCAADEMSVGKGGKIIQKIYEDPHGIEEWKENPVKTIKTYLINASQFAEITKTKMPHKPVASEEYNGIWYNLKDENMNDVSGTKIFDNLKSVGV